MANKLVLVGITRARPHFDGKSPIFSIGYGNGDGDVLIPAIILVSSIFPYSLKLLKIFTIN